MSYYSKRERVLYAQIWMWSLETRSLSISQSSTRIYLEISTCCYQIMSSPIAARGCRPKHRWACSTMMSILLLLSIICMNNVHNNICVDAFSSSSSSLAHQPSLTSLNPSHQLVLFRLSNNNRRQHYESSQSYKSTLSAVKTASSSSESATSSRLKRTTSFTDWAKQNDIK